ncbi:MAG: hypothetical protein GC184_10115 [Rhizobiales bacterium]|nr:hypothetical protein [Hyphomicrobiales bacterium]
MAKGNQFSRGRQYLLAGVLGLASLGFMTSAAEARGAVVVSPRHAPTVVYVHKAPPRALVEVRPVRPGPHAVWIGGYYRWAGPRYVWVPGYWERHPRGVWVPGHWRNTPHGHVWVAGYWR